MRFMLQVRANRDSEAGVLPSQELIEAMFKFNQEMTAAGVMLAAEGLQASSKGARISYAGARRTVVDGPFNPDELIAGFWIWEVRSMDEAVEWLKRCPNPMPGESEVEIRSVFEAADFGENFTPQEREREERLGEKSASRK